MWRLSDLRQAKAVWWGIHVASAKADSSWHAQNSSDLRSCPQSRSAQIQPPLAVTSSLQFCCAAAVCTDGDPQALPDCRMLVSCIGTGSGSGSVGALAPATPVLAALATKPDFCICLVERLGPPGASAAGTLALSCPPWLRMWYRPAWFQGYLPPEVSHIDDAAGYWAAVARAAALGWTQQAVEALASHSAMLRWADEAGRASVQAEARSVPCCVWF